MHYEKIVAAYSHEKGRATIEHTCEALLKRVRELDEEEHRALREGLDEESLAILDLLREPDLKASDGQLVFDAIATHAQYSNEDGARRGEDAVANSGICQRYGGNSLLLLPCCPESAPILMLYIMYNMVQRLPAGIRRHLSGDFVGAELHMQHIRRSGHGSSTESSVSSAAAL